MRRVGSSGWDYAARIVSHLYTVSFDFFYLANGAPDLGSEGDNAIRSFFALRRAQNHLGEYRE